MQNLTYICVKVLFKPKIMRFKFKIIQNVDVVLSDLLRANWGHKFAFYDLQFLIEICKKLKICISRVTHEFATKRKLFSKL